MTRTYLRWRCGPRATGAAAAGLRRSGGVVFFREEKSPRGRATARRAPGPSPPPGGATGCSRFRPPTCARGARMFGQNAAAKGPGTRPRHAAHERNASWRQGKRGRRLLHVPRELDRLRSQSRVREDFAAVEGRHALVVRDAVPGAGRSRARARRREKRRVAPANALLELRLELDLALRRAVQVDVEYLQFCFVGRRGGARGDGHVPERPPSSFNFRRSGPAPVGRGSRRPRVRPTERGRCSGWMPRGAGFVTTGRCGQSLRAPTAPRAPVRPAAQRSAAARNPKTGRAAVCGSAPTSPLRAVGSFMLALLRRL